MVTVGKRLLPGRARLLGVIFAAIAIPAALIAIVSTLSYGAVRPGEATELLQHPNAKKATSMGQRSMVAQLLTKQLQDDVKTQEGRLYAQALKEGGIKLDPVAKSAVVDEVASVKRTPASLAVDPKLQDNVQLASQIADRLQATTKAHAKHVAHAMRASDSNMEARLELAAQILATDKNSKHSPAAHQVKSVAQHLREQIDKRMAQAKAHHVEHKPAAKKTVKKAVHLTVEQSLAARLNQDVRMKESALYNKEITHQLSAHPDLQQLVVQKQRQPVMHAAPSRHHPKTMAESKRLDDMLLEHALRNALDQNVQSVLNKRVVPENAPKSLFQFSGDAKSAKKPVKGHETNLELENSLKSKLDKNVASLEKEQEYKTKLVGRQPSEAKHSSAHSATIIKKSRPGIDNALPGRMQLEEAFKNELNSKTSNMQKQLLMHSLGLASKAPHVSDAAQGQDTTTTGRHESLAQIKKDKEHAEEYAMENMLKSELDKSVNVMEQKEYVRSKIQQIQHPNKASHQVSTHLAPIEDTFKGKKLTEFQMEAVLRGQLNARVAQKEKHTTGAELKKLASNVLNA